MDDNRTAEELKRELEVLTQKYNHLLEKFEKVFNYYEEGFKIASNTLTSIKMENLFTPGYIPALFQKTETLSQKIRENAENVKTEFDDMMYDISLSNYREIRKSEEETREKIRHINNNLIFSDIQSKFDDIMDVVKNLGIPEKSAIVKKNLDNGIWKVINTENSSVIYEGRVNYKS